MQLENESLPKSRIRLAFKKYGLSKTVYSEGIYDQFKFEILEKCSENQLLEREDYYIKFLKPEYNCDIYTNPRSYAGLHTNRSKKIWIQYHNNSVMKYWPAEDVLSYNPNPLLSDAYHYTTSRKRSVYYSKGDDLFLVVGKKVKNRTFYFLWTKTIIEDIETRSDDVDDRVLWMIGSQQFCYPPILLNNVPGFYEFLKKVGNFGLGLTSIGDKEFTQNLYGFFDAENHDNEIFYTEYINKIKAIVTNELELVTRTIS